MTSIAPAGGPDHLAEPGPSQLASDEHYSDGMGITAWRNFYSRHRLPICGVYLFLIVLMAETTTSVVVRVLALISFAFFAVAVVKAVVENTKEKREAPDS